MSLELNLNDEFSRMASREASHPLPSPGLIWWRAEIERVRRARTESARPVAFVYAASCVMVAGIALASDAPGLLEWLTAPIALASAAVVWKLYSDSSAAHARTQETRR